jgi:hypothetical protein
LRTRLSDGLARRVWQWGRQGGVPRTANQCGPEAILDRLLDRGRLARLRGTLCRTSHLERAESGRNRGQHWQDFPEPTNQHICLYACFHLDFNFAGA